MEIYLQIKDIIGYKNDDLNFVFIILSCAIVLFVGKTFITFLFSWFDK